MKQKFLPVLTGIIILLFLCTGCSKNITPVSQTGFYFDTVITITLYDTADFDADRCNELLSSCFALCETYENRLSRTKKGSDIWNINHAHGKPVTVHPETAALLEKAIYYCEETDGLIDITIAPVSDLWDFSSDSLAEKASHSIPATDQLNARLSHVDYQQIQIDNASVTLTDPDGALDLGCIAKGYIADQLKAFLTEQGVKSALINLGGNIQTIGNKPDGSPYVLGIQKPFDKTGNPIATLSVSDASLVSSGIYERYFEVDDVLYHHLLNPKTGFPQQNDLLGVTILAASSTEADMLSTTAYLLGFEKGMAYIESLPDAEAVFITKDFALHPSSGLSGLLQIR